MQSSEISSSEIASSLSSYFPASIQGKVEDFVDQVQEMLARAVDVARVFLVGHALFSGPMTSADITSEKPRMAFSGVRSSCDMDARKRDLARFCLFRPAPRLVRHGFGDFEFGDQVVLLSLMSEDAEFCRNSWSLM